MDARNTHGPRIQLRGRLQIRHRACNNAEIDTVKQTAQSGHHQQQTVVERQLAIEQERAGSSQGISGGNLSFCCIQCFSNFRTASIMGKIVIQSGASRKNSITRKRVWQRLGLGWLGCLTIAGSFFCWGESPRLVAGEKHAFTLKPFEVLTLEVLPEEQPIMVARRH